MPLVFRSMVPDTTGLLPEVADTKTALGIIEMMSEDDTNGDIHSVLGLVKPGRHGMSVAPSPEWIPIHRIPKRLKSNFPLDRGVPSGKNTAVCWKTGDGAFADSRFDVGLLFHLDLEDSNHGLVGPDSEVALAVYREALGNTQPNWMSVPWPWE